MKKLIPFSILIISIMSFSSLKAQLSFGPGVVYGTNIGSPGFSASGSFDVTNKIAILASYGYFLNPYQFVDGSNSHWSTVDLDAAYKCYKMSDRSDLYVLAGVNVLYGKAASSIAEYNTLTGANIGVGWKINIGNKLDLMPEAKYTIGDFNYLRFGVKLMFGI